MPPISVLTGLDVLVIEDDTDTRDNLRDILELDAHRVSTAGCARDVLGRTDLAGLDVVILDRRLPDASADDLLPILRELAPRADVIVVTGYGDVDGAIVALRRGAADYLLKPINPELLRASIARTAEKRQLARAHEQSETVFRLLVETAECLVVILRENGRLIFSNSFAADMCGAAAVELAKSTSFDCLIPEAARSAFQADILGRTVTGHRHGLEFPLACASGSESWILWNARGLPEYEGRPALLMVGLDTTERRKAQERVLQSERLAAIGQMVTGLAHESRNALQRSQACLEMLSLEVESQPEAIRLVQRIQKAQDHLHHLYEEVRGYAAPIVLRQQACDIAELIRSTWDHLELLRKDKPIGLAWDVRTGSTCCSADPHALEQVFRNILENSIAACAGEGSITVTLEEALSEGTAALCIRIRDTGPGLSVEQAERIFDPFFTTKTEGTGLGMAIAKRIVDAHQGRIAVGHGRPGAEIVIFLPQR